MALAHEVVGRAVFEIETFDQVRNTATRFVPLSGVVQTATRSATNPIHAGLWNDSSADGNGD